MASTKPRLVTHHTAIVYLPGLVPDLTRMRRSPRRGRLTGRRSIFDVTTRRSRRLLHRVLTASLPTPRYVQPGTIEIAAVGSRGFPEAEADAGRAANETAAKAATTVSLIRSPGKALGIKALVRVPPSRSRPHAPAHQLYHPYARNTESSSGYFRPYQRQLDRL
jgi:hypothetical protein